MVEASIECVKPKRFWYVLVQYVLCKGSTSLSSRKLRQSVPPQNDHSMCLMCISAVMGPFATNNCATEKKLLVILGERPRQNSYTDIACFTWNLVCVYVYYTIYIPTTFFSINKLYYFCTQFVILGQPTITFSSSPRYTTYLHNFSR